MTLEQNLFYAIEHNHLETVKELIVNHPDLKISTFSSSSTINYYHYSPLLLAVALNNEAITSFLLTQGASPNAQEERGYTCLHAAIINNHYNISKLLLEQKADPNIQENLGYAPLHSAVEAKSFILTDLLLRFGAHVHLSTISGITPLHMASSNNEDHLAIANLLLSYGANPNALDYLGKTPLDYAQEKGCFNILQILLEAQHAQSSDSSALRTPSFSSDDNEALQEEHRPLLPRIIAKILNFFKKILEHIGKWIGLISEKINNVRRPLKPIIVEKLYEPKVSLEIAPASLRDIEIEKEPSSKGPQHKS